MPSFDEIETQIDVLLDKSEDELTEEEQLWLEEALDVLAHAEGEKADRTAFLIKKWESKGKFLKGEGQVLSDKGRAYENRAKRLKERFKYHMVEHGLTRISGEKYSICLQNNSQASLRVLDPTVIPSQYWNQPEPVLMNSLVLSDIKAGVVVPGVSAEVGQHIRIR